MFKKDKKKKITIQKYQPVFVTTDNARHIGEEYDWGIVERLRCSIPEYIMIDVQSDGYLKDKSDIMYPLSNIVSIKWTLLEEKSILDDFDIFKVFMTTEELNDIAR